MIQMSNKDKKEKLDDAAEKAREEENPSDEIDKNEDRKATKGKDLERDEEGIDKTKKEIQDSFE